MKHTDYSLSNIVYYCLGSTTFKKKNKINFINSIKAFDSHQLSRILYKLHILSIFYYELKKIKSNNEFSYIRSFLYYQNKCNNILSNELINFKNNLPSNIKPLILKGPGLWGRIYKQKNLRRVLDLDILINNSNDLETSCLVLEKIGYRNKIPNYYKLIFDKRIYEITPFYKVIYIAENHSNSKKLEDVINMFGTKSIRKLGNREFSFKISFELHKLIYKYQISKLEPKLSKSDVSMSKYFKGYDIMTDKAILPYLSIKFYSDAMEYINGHNNNPKALKLAFDFVKVLNSINKSEFRKSISIAKKWKAEYYYLLMLNSIRNLIPDINFYGLGVERNNILHEFLNKVNINYGLIRKGL